MLLDFTFLEKLCLDKGALHAGSLVRGSPCGGPLPTTALALNLDSLGGRRGPERGIHAVPETPEIKTTKKKKEDNKKQKSVGKGSFFSTTGKYPFSGVTGFEDKP